jgi:hypothetical protein
MVQLERVMSPAPPSPPAQEEIPEESAPTPMDANTPEEPTVDTHDSVSPTPRTPERAVRKQVRFSNTRMPRFQYTELSVAEFDPDGTPESIRSVPIRRRKSNPEHTRWRVWRDQNRRPRRRRPRKTVHFGAPSSLPSTTRVEVVTFDEGDAPEAIRTLPERLCTRTAKRHRLQFWRWDWTQLDRQDRGDICNFPYPDLDS